MGINIKINVHPINNWLKENGYTLEDEIELYNKQLQDVYDNPRDYLDNLEYLRTYRVRWKNYHYKTATIPHSFIKKTSPNKKSEVTDL